MSFILSNSTIFKELNGRNSGNKNVLFTSNKSRIFLTKKLASGGEGIIYETNVNLLAKIYKPSNNTRAKYEKLKLMIDKNINFRGICFPCEILYSTNGKFVGFLMPRGDGIELQRSLFIKKLFLKKFPGWTREDLVTLCISILEKIRYLHSKDIILGDINPMNILIKSPNEVYFVDCDSYQIGKYPCSVGTINFTAPEIQGRNFSEFLRTKNHENFAIATLLFMVMLPGKLPYSHQGGESMSTNIKKMHFPYAFEDKCYKNTPDGLWKFMWSHLSYKIKYAFFNTFNQGGKYTRKRLSVDEWIKLFKTYKFALENGYMKDEMSNEIYPTRLKKFYEENKFLLQKNFKII